MLGSGGWTKRSYRGTALGRALREAARRGLPPRRQTVLRVLEGGGRKGARERPLGKAA